LNGGSWRLADLPHGLGDPTDIHSFIGALSRGKGTLEGMLRESRPDYRGTCFRAGGFYAQPSGAIIRAMKRAGILLDSFLVKGYRRCRPWLVDYSQVSTPKPCWWTTEEHLSVEGDPGVNVLELPVSSQTQPYWKNLHPTKLRTTLRRRRRQAASSSAAGTAGKVTSVPTFWTVLGSLFRPHYSTFDYCKLTGKDMWRRIDKLRDTGGPVVLIGHAKDFFRWGTSPAFSGRRITGCDDPIHHCFRVSACMLDCQRSRPALQHLRRKSVPAFLHTSFTAPSATFGPAHRRGPGRFSFPDP
jgi:hypothetical protein